MSKIYFVNLPQYTLMLKGDTKTIRAVLSLLGDKFHDELLVVSSKKEPFLMVNINSYQNREELVNLHPNNCFNCFLPVVRSEELRLGRNCFKCARCKTTMVV